MAVKRARPAEQDVPSEAMIRALLADAETGVVLVDPAGRVSALNAAATRMLASARRVVGTPAAPLFRTVVPGEDPVGEGLAAAHTEREAVLVPEGASELPALIRTYRLGEARWLLVTVRDMTQMRRLREELRRHERLATLGQLSAGVAHEIRNPLAGIGTSAQVLLRRFEPRDDRARFVRVILDEVARLDRIVTSLLQYARPRTPQLRPATLADCVSEVIASQADHLARSGVKVELDAAPRMGALYIDADLVKQVVLNIVMNAIQAMPKGGALRIEVRRARRRPVPRGPGRRATDRAERARRPAPGWVVHQQVRFSDTGPGIPRGVLAKLFDPFFSTKPRGTGLGLSISQTIMHEHGGSIEVASREGRGTTVLLNFPVEKRHGERRQPDAHPGQPAHAAHR